MAYISKQRILNRGISNGSETLKINTQYRQPSGKYK